MGGELTGAIESLDPAALNSDELMAEVEQFLRNQPDA